MSKKSGTAKRSSRRPTAAQPPGVVLWHRTRIEIAHAILAHGFKDGSDGYGTSTKHAGVWLSDQQLDENEGAWGGALLKVTLRLPKADLATYEWVEDNKGYREFLVPAALINKHATVELAEEELLDEIEDPDEFFRLARERLAGTASAASHDDPAKQRGQRAQPASPRSRRRRAQ